MIVVASRASADDMTNTGTLRLHWPAGSLASEPWELELDQRIASWSWTSLRVLALPAGASHSFSSFDEELLILPLSGSCDVTCDGHQFEVQGRSDVFDGLTDFVYIPRDSQVEVSTPGGGRFAVPGAKARNRLPARYQPVEEVSVELRGAGNCSRRVVNYCMADTFDADRLLVCEVITPSGNWSSYPPHKHDETRSGETELEEIYYFQIEGGSGGEGMAFQRLYGTEHRPIDFLGEVHDSDVVLIPHGYHGPSMAPPGYDLYYLNVMAGPGDRSWLATDDPHHAWVRAGWAGEPVDSRLLAISKSEQLSTGSTKSAGKAL